MSILVSLVACEATLPSAPESEEVIAEPIEGLTQSQLRNHLIGDELFAKVYTPEEGLGPIFIQTSNKHSLIFSLFFLFNLNDEIFE